MDQGSLLSSRYLDEGAACARVPTENRSVLAYRRAHPRSAPFLSLTNFSDVTQAPDAGVIAQAGLHDPVPVHSSTGQLIIRAGQIELPPWSFVWLIGS